MSSSPRAVVAAATASTCPSRAGTWRFVDSCRRCCTRCAVQPRDWLFPAVIRTSGSCQGTCTSRKSVRGWPQVSCQAVGHGGSHLRVKLLGHEALAVEHVDIVLLRIGAVATHGVGVSAPGTQVQLFSFELVCMQHRLAQCTTSHIYQCRHLATIKERVALFYN